MLTLLEHVDHASHADKMSPMHVLYNRVGHDKFSADPSQSRSSPELKGKVPAKSTRGMREHFALANSFQPMYGAYRQFPGLLDLIQQRSQTASISASRENSPLTCTDETASDDPFTAPPQLRQHEAKSSVILVPDISFNPDLRVLDVGFHNFWVAIELSARLHQAGSEHGKLSQNGTPDSQYQSHSRRLGE